MFFTGMRLGNLKNSENGFSVFLRPGKALFDIYQPHKESDYLLEITSKSRKKYKIDFVWIAEKS